MECITSVGRLVLTDDIWKTKEWADENLTPSKTVRGRLLTPEGVYWDSGEGCVVVPLVLPDFEGPEYFYAAFNAAGCSSAFAESDDDPVELADLGLPEGLPAKLQRLATLLNQDSRNKVFCYRPGGFESEPLPDVRLTLEIYGLGGSGSDSLDSAAVLDMVAGILG